MRYTGSLAKKEREQIFSLFVDKRSLKFSQIEKSIKIRSNLVAYHLDRMRKEGLLKKDGEQYSLTPKSKSSSRSSLTSSGWIRALFLLCLSRY